MLIMSEICSKLVVIAVYGIFFSIIWIIVNLIRKKSKRKPLYCFAVCGICAFCFLIVGLFFWIAANNSKQSLVTVQDKKEELSKSTEDNLSIDDIKDDNTDEEKNDKDDMKKNSTENSIENEQYFKSMCTEIVYNDLDEEWVGKWVTKEILFTSSGKDEYQCGSTEDFDEKRNVYQHTYRIYDIFDCRFDKSIPICENNVIRIYGIVTDVGTNYANGLDYPIINMYYADYIRQWGENKN